VARAGAWLAAAALVLATFARALAGGPDFAAPEPGSYALPPLGAAADGAVLLPDGTATTLHALFAGKAVLLAFVYSACSDAEGCPLATAAFHRVGRLLRDDPDTRAGLRLLSLSFDPARDTPEAMARFAGSVDREGLDWQFLTTASPEALRPILAAYGQAIVPERDPEGRPSGGIAHLLRVFLIDPSGRIRNVYSASLLGAEFLVSDVRTLLREPRASQGSDPGPIALPAAGRDAMVRPRRLRRWRSGFADWPRCSSREPPSSPARGKRRAATSSARRRSSIRNSTRS
jgi:cytochrome c peroxidase